MGYIYQALYASYLVKAVLSFASMTDRTAPRPALDPAHRAANHRARVVPGLVYRIANRLWHPSRLTLGRYISGDKME